MDCDGLSGASETGVMLMQLREHLDGFDRHSFWLKVPFNMGLGVV